MHAAIYECHTMFEIGVSSQEQSSRLLDTVPDIEANSPVNRQHSISLEALEVLEAIERKGSFASAANALYRVPSAISYTVQKLEGDLAPGAGEPPATIQG